MAIATATIMAKNEQATSLVQDRITAVHNEESDRHPFVPIIFAFIIAIGCSTALIGSIVLGLALRYSGVMAP